MKYLLLIVSLSNLVVLSPVCAQEVRDKVSFQEVQNFTLEQLTQLPSQTLFEVDGRRDYVGPRWWWKAAIYAVDATAVAVTFGASVPIGLAGTALLSGAAAHDILRGKEVRGLNKILGHSHQDNEEKQAKYQNRVADLCTAQLAEVMPPDSEVLAGERATFYSPLQNALYFCQPSRIEADQVVQPRHFIYRASGVKISLE